MSDAFGNDFITLTDDEGNSFELEHLDTLEIDDETYMAFLPADMSEDDEDFGISEADKAFTRSYYQEVSANGIFL